MKLYWVTLLWFGLVYEMVNSTETSHCFEVGVDFDSGKANKLTEGVKFKTQSPYDCDNLCKLVIGCEGWSWHDPTKNGHKRYTLISHYYCGNYMIT